MVKIPEGSEYKIVGYLAITLGSLTVCLVGMIMLFDRYNQTRAASTIANTPPASSKFTPQPTPAPKIELLDTHWEKDMWGGLSVTLKNISPEPIRQAIPSLIYWTKDDQMIKRGSGHMELPLMPGQTSTFRISNDSHPEASYVTVVIEDYSEKVIPFKETPKA